MEPVNNYNSHTVLVTLSMKPHSLRIQVTHDLVSAFGMLPVRNILFTSALMLILGGIRSLSTSQTLMGLYIFVLL